MNPRKDLATELGALQGRLEGKRGKRFWRSLDELAQTEAFQELMQREFPEQASIWPDRLNRRRFLSLMGASLALAGLAGCSVRPAPSVDLVPYVRQPEEIIPGKPLFYATTMTLGRNAVGLLVETHTGRPTKVEGNPDHPASLGATDIYCQASVLGLYDPDRSQTVTYRGQTRTWDDAITALRPLALQLRERQGAGLHILTESILSPTFAQQLRDLLQDPGYVQAKWHVYEPLHNDAAFQASHQAFGEYVYPFYDFRRADVVVALDADFLMELPGSIRYAADFMSRRRVRTGTDDADKATMNRLYALEPNVTCTGAKADNRLPLRARDIENFARALAHRLGLAEAGGTVSGEQAKWVEAIARDLEAHRGGSLVIAGDRQPAAVHLLAHWMNDHLGNVGKTVLHAAPLEARPPGAPLSMVQSITELTQALRRGEVEALLVLGGNPVYTAPNDLNFVEALRTKTVQGKEPVRIHLSLYQDETSRLCDWHLPEAHFLEAWSDARAYDTTFSLVQPLIQPLYDSRSAHEVLSLLATGRMIPGRELVRSYWSKHWQEYGGGDDFETWWQTALHDGKIPGRPQLRNVALRTADLPRLLQGGATPSTPAGADAFELVLQPDPTVYDGRFANNSWLQECPKPITKLTWDNAALMSPDTAKQLGVGLDKYLHGGEHGGYLVSVVELQLGDRSLRAPVWIVPGHADGSITVSLGYGRMATSKLAGHPEERFGFDAYGLRTSDKPWIADGLRVTKTNDTYPLACTQQHHLMENREPVRAATLEEYHHHPRFAAEEEEKKAKSETERARRPLTLYKPWNYDAPKQKWGMAIDLTACTGCSACVVACQAENNIPVVGKDQVAAGREMHWLRIDRYIEGDNEERPDGLHFQPVPCMHCEHAPCEYVCPTEATVHSADGLNDMIYNRCVGTRFCSNNCPYKVRRFNFFFYADYKTEPVRQQYNPDVTVRSRGVMEKCTYCVQRIRAAQIGAETENRSIRDGEVLTACQAACPTQAIVFGDMNDPNSAVKQWKDSPLFYALLADLNTLPRTTYLAALANPNPELKNH